jgi:transcriptional regulator with XRE-family HTH domain
MPAMSAIEEGTTAELEPPTWTLGWRLRRSLDHAGISVETMADRCGVSRQTASRWMHDEIVPRPIFLREWSMVCGVPYRWLTEPLIEAEIAASDPPPPKVPARAGSDGRTRPKGRARRTSISRRACYAHCFS